MSLFNRRPIEVLPKKDISAFRIPQFVKIEGLKIDSIKKYKTTEFISPIFGMSVKDKTVAPYIVKNSGDIRKKYDAFRTKPLADRTGYNEFKSTMVSNEVRKEIFGQDVVIDTTRKYENERKKTKDIDIPFHKTKKEPEFFHEYKTYNEKKVVMPKVNSDDFDVRSGEPVVLEPAKVETVNKANALFEKRFNPTKSDEVVIEKESVPKITETFVQARPETFTKKEPVRRPVSRAPYIFPSPTMFSKITRDQNARPEWLINQEAIVNQTLVPV